MPPQPLGSSNLVVLAGTLSGPVRRRTLPSGEEVVEFDVVTRDVIGRGAAPVVWLSPGRLAETLDAGSAVVVVGVVRRRFFRAGGVTQSRTEVVALRVADAARRAAVRRLRDEAAAMLTGPP